MHLVHFRQIVCVLESLRSASEADPDSVVNPSVFFRMTAYEVLSVVKCISTLKN